MVILSMALIHGRPDEVLGPRMPGKVTGDNCPATLLAALHEARLYDESSAYCPE